MKPEKEKVKIIRAKCACNGPSRNEKGKLCPHHNHAVCYPESASEWDYIKNGDVRPENIFPSTPTKYWWICSNGRCRMSYPQPPADRGGRGSRCPYCAPNPKVCQWNCLATTHPDLCKEIDPANNSITGNDVTRGSNVSVNWLCLKISGEQHRWPAAVATRTAGIGCPQCNRKGYAQQMGGHEYFVKEADKVHDGKYSYPEQYRGSGTPINIYCPVVTKDDESMTRHGNFLQTPSAHKAGQGCMKCFHEQTESKAMTMIQSILTSMGQTKYVNCLPEKTFPGMRDVKVLSCDRFLSDWCVVIEYDGQQHFRLCSSWGGEAAFVDGHRRDLIKDEYLVRNGISLLRIPYTVTDPVEIRSMIEHVIYLRRSGLQVYATYQDYYDNTVKTVDVSRVKCIIVDKPKG